MRYSTVTSKGQTTIRTTIRVHPGVKPLKGALVSSKGKGMSFAQIRTAAVRNATASR